MIVSSLTGLPMLGGGTSPFPWHENGEIMELSEVVQTIYGCQRKENLIAW